MRKLLVGLVAVLSLSLVTSQVSVAAVKPGTKCSKAGATSTSNGKKYTCIKSGKKLVWKKGVVVAKPKPVASPTPEPTATPTPTPTPTPSSTQTVAPTPTPTVPSTPLVFSDVCAKDPEVPAEWASYQEFALKTFRCARPYSCLLYTSPSPRDS